MATPKLAPRPQVDISPRCDCGHVAFIHAGGFGKCLAAQCKCKASSIYDMTGAKWGRDGTAAK